MIETHRYMFLPEAERRIIDTLKETGRPMNVSEIVEDIFGMLPYREKKQKRSTTIIHLNAMCRKGLLTKTIVDRLAIYDVKEASNDVRHRIQHADGISCCRVQKSG